MWFNKILNKGEIKCLFQIKKQNLFSLRKQLFKNYILRMVGTRGSDEGQFADGQTQFGNTRCLEPSDSIFVFKETQSDYEEPSSDQEVRQK